MPPPTRSNTLGWKPADASNGVATRAKRSTVSSGENQLVGKRKAESPLKKATKRSAFGDITNAVGKSATDTKKVLKNVSNTHSKNLKTKKAEEVPSKPIDKKEVDKRKFFVERKAPVEKATNKLDTRRTLSRVSSLQATRPTKKTEASVSVVGPLKTAALKSKVTESTTSTAASSVVPKPPVRSSARLSARLSLNSNSNSDSGETSLYVSALDILVPEDGPSKADDTVLAAESPKGLSSSQKKLPPGVEDFDAENAHDPFQVSDYAMDIFEYLKDREARYKIGDYMEKQVSLTRYMRSLLVDWMVEVQENFELNHETLYLAVKIVDIYLSKVIVGKESLQLVGAAAMFIASKYDERVPPLVDDLTYICDGAYNPEQLISMEIDILRVIDFDLSMPISYRFLRRYGRCARIAMPQLTLARYILELSLMEYSMVSLSDSKLAAAALLLSMKMQNLGSWTPTLEYYSGYKLEEIKDICLQLNDMLHKKPKSALATVRNKYSHKVFFEVANIPLIADLIL